MSSIRLFGAASLSVVLGGLLAGGCSSPAVPTESIAVTTLAESTDAEGGLKTEATFVIRDADTLRRVWAQVFGSRTTREVPSVNFNEVIIVIAAMGAEPTTGYEIKITGATRRDRGVVVGVTTVSPGPSCAVSQVITYPVALSRLPRTDANVGFEFTRTTRACTGR